VVVLIDGLNSEIVGWSWSVSGDNEASKYPYTNGIFTSEDYLFPSPQEENYPEYRLPLTAIQSNIDSV
jgi:hypothetical protein